MDCLKSRQSSTVLLPANPLTNGCVKATIADMLVRLKQWREKRGLSLRELGERSGVHYVTIVKMEAGRLDPQLSTLLKLCKALNITLNQLVKKR